MKYQIAFVAALWCMLVSPVAAEKTAAETDSQPSRQVASQGRCEVEPTEAQQIAKFSDKISRRGDELIIRLKDGTELIKRDSPDNGEGYVDCDGKVNVAYVFYDFIEPWFLIREGYYEGGATLCINWETGVKQKVDRLHAVSPDRTRFITMGDPHGGPCNAEIWKLSRTKIVREWLADSACAYDFRWSDSTTVEVGFYYDEVIALLTCDGSSWKCAGSSEICVTPRASCESKKTGVVRLLRRGHGARTTGELGPDLRTAAAEGHLEAVERLLDTSADVNGQGPNGQTPLMFAAWHGRFEVVKMLLDRGADPNSRDKDCSTALSGPCFGSLQRNHEVTKLLVSKGADVNAKDKQDSAAWIRAAGADPELTRWLVDHGADVNATDVRGDTALVTAAMDGKLDTTKVLLELGADVNARGRYGSSPLMWAAQQNHLEVVKLLLSHGASVNDKNEECVTALMEAALLGHGDMIDLLLSSGADINAADKQGCTALLRAAERSHKEVVDQLIARGAKTTLHVASWRGDLKEVRRLVQNGADVNMRGGSFRRTPLMYAVASERVEVVKLLLDNGADANARDYNCGTALEIAKEGNYKEIERLLRARGATR